MESDHDRKWSRSLRGCKRWSKCVRKREREKERVLLVFEGPERSVVKPAYAICRLVLRYRLQEVAGSPLNGLYFGNHGQLPRWRSFPRWTSFFVPSSSSIYSFHVTQSLCSSFSFDCSHKFYRNKFLFILQYYFK